MEELARFEWSQALIIIGMYALWMQRNKRRHGEQSMLIKKAVEWAADMAFDLWQLAKPLLVLGDRGEES